ncbi:MAG: polyribonucleotide nucleotidyltransferase [Flavobacteriales bacterium]|nr:MAG: polyribonucleotide nucleotidyltransferase [Flavobacteriales bacterium]|tara:strand:- start:4766 stop:6874 length:2109 start_codon:yes stop_codon:yes gene_type:complete
MIPKPFSQTITLTDGREITIETGKLAKQAHGSVVVKMGNCMLLSTVVSSYGASSLDFLPLTVDYREKFASAGRFPGGFFKREARPSSEEILTMRIVDRVLRPLFPKDYHSETQVMIQLMSSDENVMPDALVGLAASAAISLSDIPFDGPISEVRVARIEGDFIINPSRSQLTESDIDIMVGATIDSVVMVEGEFNEISEEEMADAIKFAHDEIKRHIEAQKNLIKDVGISSDKRDYERAEEDAELEAEISEKIYQKSYDIAKKGLSKNERSESFGLLKEELIESYDDEILEEKKDLITNYFNKAQKKAIRDLVLNDGTRLDGRKTEDIRDIWTEVGYLPSTHGSAVFTRGETQSLASVTLGTSREVNMIDMPTNQSEETFYLHYNFPPFSTGEARPLRGTSRREIGHGMLAQRALEKVMPEDCPYTVRIVSEILESNGSSSMASVCAGSLALMDAGIKIKSNVSGIAMGLISEGDKYAVLSDILGDEDHLGDMDFKVTGTKDGITACQMDIKIKGLKYEILVEALQQAKKGRLEILEKLDSSIQIANDTVKPHAPKMVNMEIPKDFIGSVIGPGGKMIQELQKESDTTIVINEKDEVGIVEILGVDQEKIDNAIERIKNIIFQPVIDEVYKVTVVKILDFGAVVEFVPGKEVLLHVSEIAWERVEKVTEYLNIGDQIEVKYLGIDKRTRKQKVSRKVLLERK